MEFGQVVSPPKDVSELLAWLQEKLVVTEVKLTDFSNSFAAHLVYNAIHAITNQKMMLDQDSLEFVCYKLEKAACNDEYNDILDCSHEEFVYVIIEKKTGYILSNSSKLFLELVIAKGVTEEDIEKETVYMQYYLDCLEAYQEKSY